MSKENVFVIDDPSLIGWVEDGVTSDGDPIYKWVSSGGDNDGSVSGASMVISETEPTDKVEGMQWMEVPADGDATMWIYDGDKWLQQPGGKDGADGADGLWTDNGDTSISYTDGSVGIGTSNPSYAAEISNDATAYLAVTSGDTNFSGVLFGKKSDKSQSRVVHDNNDKSLQLWAGSLERMRIDANGDVGIGGPNPGHMLSVVATDNSQRARTHYKDSTGVELNAGVWGESGQITASNSALSINTYAAHPITFNANQGGGRPDAMTIGPDGRVDITGSLYVNGTPKIGYQELVTTLVTLRQATMDETQDIRESLRSAIDELVAGFEQEIATMPAGEES